MIKTIKKHLLEYIGLKDFLGEMDKDEKISFVKALNEYELTKKDDSYNKLFNLYKKVINEMASPKYKAKVFKKFLAENLTIPKTLKEEVLKTFPYPSIINSLHLNKEGILSPEETNVLKIEAKTCSDIINNIYRKGVMDYKNQPAEIIKNIQKAFSLEDRNSKDNKLYTSPRFTTPKTGKSEELFTSSNDPESEIIKAIQDIKETVTSANVTPPFTKPEEKKMLIKTKKSKKRIVKK